GFGQVEAAGGAEGGGGQEQARAIRQGDGLEALDGAGGGLANHHGAAGGLQRSGEYFGRAGGVGADDQHQGQCLRGAGIDGRDGYRRGGVTRVKLAQRSTAEEAEHVDQRPAAAGAGHAQVEHDALQLGRLAHRVQVAGNGWGQIAAGRDRQTVVGGAERGQVTAPQRVDG